ncbi:hypothetical protein BG005_006266 [Podila minutissima]|nr:hypothetical protein BG005_006266 [Podila minutissima]
MESFEFPDVRLVSVGAVMFQVTTLIRGQSDPNKARPLPLSDDASDLLQKVIWAEVMTEHKEPSTIRLTDPEFSLVLSVAPWKLARQYEILVDGKLIKTSPFKIRADLQDPEDDDDEEQES